MGYQSVFRYIVEHLQGDYLPDDFTLPRENKELEVFDDGAVDGINIYHLERPVITEEDGDKILQAINAASEGEYDSAEEIFFYLGDKYRIINIIDDIQECILENTTSKNAGKLYSFAIHMMVESKHIECVKAAMVIAEMFKNDREVKQIIRILGLSDEFTVFSIFVMRNWENRNIEDYNLARKLNGWGKIHAVSFVKPENQEIENWFLTEGIKNNVMPEYSALNCFIKGNVRNRLDCEDMSYEEFHAICKIINALLQDEPVPGISEIDDPQETIIRLLNHSEDLMPLDIDDYEILFRILEWLETGDNRNKTDLKFRINQILYHPACRKLVEEQVQQGRHIGLARNLGIPYKEQLYSKMEEDFDEYYKEVQYLMDDAEYIGKVLNLFRRKLPLEDMATGASREHGIGEEYEDYRKLDTLLREFDNHAGLGLDFMEVAFRSPVIKVRNTAIIVIHNWVDYTRRPLQKISPGMCEILQRVKEDEVIEDFKEQMDLMLDGAQSFEWDWKKHH